MASCRSLDNSAANEWDNAVVLHVHLSRIGLQRTPATEDSIKSTGGKVKGFQGVLSNLCFAICSAKWLSRIAWGAISFSSVVSFLQRSDSCSITADSHGTCRFALAFCHRIRTRSGYYFGPFHCAGKVHQFSYKKSCQFNAWMRNFLEWVGFLTLASPRDPYYEV